MYTICFTIIVFHSFQLHNHNFFKHVFWQSGSSLFRGKSVHKSRPISQQKLRSLLTYHDELAL